MNWLNIEIKTLTSPEFLGSDPVNRSTWLCLMRYCAQQENGGVVKNCSLWGDRKWQQLIAITKEEAQQISELWEWKNDGIKVWEYPADKEAEIQANRKNGKKGGRPKVSPEKPHGSQSVTPSGSKSPKRKGKEGKGKEEKFMQFWEAYPIRAGKKVGKKVSHDLFYKMDIEDMDRIIANAKNYGVGNDYPKDPERFLKNEFWKDWDTPQTIGAKESSSQESHEGMTPQEEQMAMESYKKTGAF